MKQTILLAILVGGLYTTAVLTSTAAKPDKDKTPPVISNVVATAGTTTATVTWTTDEPADSDIDYGINTLNQHGPRDRTLVLSHTIALAELYASTTYQYCVLSRDDANNKAESCGHFDTLATTTPPPPPPPPPSTSQGGSGGARPTLAHVTGFAYPEARVIISLRSLPLGGLQEKEVVAGTDGSFTAQFDRFFQGLYLFTATAVDKNGATSVAKRYQFDFLSGDAPLMVENVVMSPTVTLSQDTVALGDDIVVSGYTQPSQRILVEVANVSYETTANTEGMYEATINTARLLPGKIILHVHPAGYDASQTKTFTLSATTVPEADLNKDSATTIADISKFLANPVDLNKDGKINAADMSIFLRAFVLLGL